MSIGSQESETRWRLQQDVKVSLAPFPYVVDDDFVAEIREIAERCSLERVYLLSIQFPNEEPHTAFLVSPSDDEAITAFGKEMEPYWNAILPDNPTIDLLRIDQTPGAEGIIRQMALRVMD